MRIEIEPASRASRGTVARLSDYELASRLSFFLWSSIPDDELLDARRARATAHEPAVLDAQVAPHAGRPAVAALRRRTSRASGCTCGTSSAIVPEQRTCSRTSTTTCGRRSGARPSCSSRASCARTAASFDLLDANYTFVNERLARSTTASRTCTARASAASRSATTARGRAARPGQHPDGHVVCRPHVAGHCAASGCSKTCWARRRRRRRPTSRRCSTIGVCRRAATSVRERMEQHRANPVCAACHKSHGPHRARRSRTSMRVGRWRTRRRSRAPSDRCVRRAAGRHGVRSVPKGCAQALLRKRRARCARLTEKLMTYALGRGARIPRRAGRPARSCAERAADRTTACRHRDRRASSRSKPFQYAGDSSRHDRHQKAALPRRTFLRGVGARLGAAAARCDGAGPDGAGADPGDSRSKRLGLSTSRTAMRNLRHRLWTPSRRGRNFAVLADPVAARAYRDRMVVIQRPGSRSPRPNAGDDGASGDHTRGTSSWLTGVHRAHRRRRRPQTAPRRTRRRHAPSAARDGAAARSRWPST